MCSVYIPSAPVVADRILDHSQTTRGNGVNRTKWCGLLLECLSQADEPFAYNMEVGGKWEVVKYLSERERKTLSWVTQETPEQQSLIAHFVTSHDGHTRNHEVVFLRSFLDGQ